MYANQKYKTEEDNEEAGLQTEEMPITTKIKIKISCYKPGEEEEEGSEEDEKT